MCARAARLREEGKEIPGPSTLDAIAAAEDVKGAVPFLVEPSELQTRVVRVNGTFKPKLLEALDGYAESHPMTRAAALELAVKQVTKAKRLAGGTPARARSSRGRRRRQAAGSPPPRGIRPDVRRPGGMAPSRAVASGSGGGI